MRISILFLLIGVELLLVGYRGYSQTKTGIKAIKPQAVSGGCHPSVDLVPDSAVLKAIEPVTFAQHIRVLASDSFEGRKPFSVGETKTIQYLQQEFSRLGLEPGNGHSYFQDVPMVEISSKPAAPLVIEGKGGTVSLNYLEEYVGGSRHEQEQVKLNNSELVFVGFGIVAPEYHWNDYAGLDVKGKTVIVLVNDPGFYDSTLFKGKRMTYYGRWTYKYEEAARQGAAGILIIHETKPASYPWTVVRSGWSKSKLYLRTSDGNKGRALLEGWITLEAAHKVFALANVSDNLLKNARKSGFKPVALGLTTSLVINNQLKKSMSHNVVAILPGRLRPEETIIYSAHWDHLGKGEAVNGDSIYNGAADNASGTGALLEIARAFTRLSMRPERSVVFLAVTAEEQGLLGSEYYTTHPIFPIRKTVADINMDVLQPFGRMKDIVVVGFGQSELEDYTQRVAASQGRIVRPEPDPSGGWYFRSDHFNFAKVGIPALYTEGGEQSLEHGEAWGKAQSEAYTAKRYHAPADQFDNSWDFSGIVEDTQLLFSVGYQLSNETCFPGWKWGSEFKGTREKTNGR